MSEKDIQALSPAIPTTDGGLAFINPGTGAVNGANRKHAHANMYQLILDTGMQDSLYFVPDSERDYGEGRYSFKVYHSKFPEAHCEIAMPGWELSRVRYMNEDEQNIWHFPRLYVDGSSWVWVLAIGWLKHNLCNQSEG